MTLPFSPLHPMRRSMTRTIATASLLTSLLYVPSAHAAAQAPASTQYAVVSLGVLDNAGSSTVVRQNNSLGEVVGGYRQGGPRKAAGAFLLSTTGFLFLTDQEPSDYSASFGINDSGEIAGSINGATSTLPFRSVRKTQFQVLPLPPGDTAGAAYAINDQGESVGFTSGPNGIHAAWWTRAGAITSLPSLPNGGAAKALAINARGDIVGNAGDGDTTAVLWPARGGVLALDTLAGFSSNRAESINNAGHIAGASTDIEAFGTRMHATFWPSGSTAPQDLGVLTGGTNSRARWISDNDSIVGTGDSSQGNRAFLWSAATGMLDLNTLSTTPSLILVDALSIDKNGVILAIGIDVNDAPPMAAMGTMVATSHVEERELPRHIVLLTPIK